MSEARTLVVKQTRSLCKATKRQKAIAQALGLGRIGRVREHRDEASVQGMIRSIRHLLEVTAK